MKSVHYFQIQKVSTIFFFVPPDVNTNPCRITNEETDAYYRKLNYPFNLMSANPSLFYCEKLATRPLDGFIRPALQLDSIYMTNDLAPCAVNTGSK